MYHDRKYEAELNAVGELAGEAAAGALDGLPGIAWWGRNAWGFEAGGDLPGAAEEPCQPSARGETPPRPAAPEEPPEAAHYLATPGKRDRDFRWVTPDPKRR